MCDLPDFIATIPVGEQKTVHIYGEDIILEIAKKALERKHEY